MKVHIASAYIVVEDKKPRQLTKSIARQIPIHHWDRLEMLNKKTGIWVALPIMGKVKGVHLGLRGKDAHKWYGLVEDSRKGYIWVVMDAPMARENPHDFPTIFL